jgi:hypothetical protein
LTATTIVVVTIVAAIVAAVVAAIVATAIVATAMTGGAYCFRGGRRIGGKYCDGHKGQRKQYQDE